jgi:hypothetical protein
MIFALPLIVEPSGSRSMGASPVAESGVSDLHDG